jgi:hypothetical protein
MIMEPVVYSIGMSAFFVAAPLAFRPFGPLYLVIATIGLVVALHYVKGSASLGDE